MPSGYPLNMQETEQMNARQMSLGLGYFSIGLGLLELAATRPIARKLGQDNRIGRGTLRLFGAREIIAGGGLLAAPAHSTLVWNRVVGDALDLAALGIAAAKRPGRRAVWGAIAFVAGATAIDTLVARKLDKTTGRMLPLREESEQVSQQPDGSSTTGHATSIEPEDMPVIHAPEVGQRKGGSR